MNPMRPLGMIVALALIIGIVIVSVGILTTRTGSEESDASPTATPEVASPVEPETEATPEEQAQLESDSVPESNESVDESATPEPEEAEPESEPTEVPEEAPPEALSEEELQQYQPNELGQIMVLMYHRIESVDNPDDVWTRTPDQFRGDLQWLYDNNFYIIPIRDYIRNEIEAPAGKRPVVLTFDDGTVGQFRMIEGEDGNLTVDPDSAIGILEEFFGRYDDFGRGGLFSILPNAPFAWPDADDQQQYAGQKLQWMVENGYELGNHTVGHINMRESSDEEIKAELARAEDMIVELVPEAQISVLAVPFGVYPEGGDTTILEGWEYEGRQYALEGALMVGAEPALSPVHTDFDPMWIPRINADDEQLGRWFSFVEDNPGIMYVSDGNPDTITIPEQPHSWLVDTLDEEKAEGTSIIRY
jgi:peptidoglycan/xylan/chitin deacetylase (PgdA/CDA1 family)